MYSELNLDLFHQAVPGTSSRIETELPVLQAIRAVIVIESHVLLHQAELHEFRLTRLQADLLEALQFLHRTNSQWVKLEEAHFFLWVMIRF